MVIIIMSFYFYFKNSTENITQILSLTDKSMIQISYILHNAWYSDQIWRGKKKALINFYVACIESWMIQCYCVQHKNL